MIKLYLCSSTKSLCQGEILKLKVAFLLYEDFTALDFIGVFDPVTRLNTMNFLPSLEWDVCALSNQVNDGS